MAVLTLSLITVGAAEADERCDDFLCIDMHDTIENRVQVTRQPDQYINRIYRVYAFREYSSKCADNGCRYEIQKSRHNAWHLDYQCRGRSENDIRVMVVYQVGHAIASLPPMHRDDGRRENWKKSHKLTVNC